MEEFIRRVVIIASDPEKVMVILGATLLAFVISWMLFAPSRKNTKTTECRTLEELGFKKTKNGYQINLDQKTLEALMQYFQYSNGQNSRKDGKR